LLQVLITWRKVIKRFGKEVDQIDLFPGIYELMEYLHNKGIAITVLSINHRNNIEEFLKQHNMLGFVSDILTSNVILGKQATLQKLLKGQKLNRNEVIYVGDETRDILVCQKVGVPIIAVTWGFNSAEGLLPHNPNYVATDINDLYKIIDNLLKDSNI